MRRLNREGRGLGKGQGLCAVGMDEGEASTGEQTARGPHVCCYTISFIIVLETPGLVGQGKGGKNRESVAVCVCVGL